MIERIDDIADPRLDDYRNLTDGHLRDHRGVFIAEGRLIVRTLLAGSRFRPRSVLVTGAAFESLRDLIDPLDQSAPADGPRVFLSGQKVVDAVAGFHVHRGCLAVAERGNPPTVEDLLGTIPSTPSVVVVLEDLLNHDNVGAVFRNASAFGLASSGAVLLSAGCVDPLYRKAVRVSMGGVLRVPFARFAPAQWPGGLRLLKNKGYTVMALTPSKDALDIREFGAERPIPDRLALLIGAEGPGLTDDALAASDIRVRIPIAPGVDSLNAATACGIALHRFSAGL